MQSQFKQFMQQQQGFAGSPVSIPKNNVPQIAKFTSVERERASQGPPLPYTRTSVHQNTSIENQNYDVKTEIRQLKSVVAALEQKVTAMGQLQQEITAQLQKARENEQEVLERFRQQLSSQMTILERKNADEGRKWKSDLTSIQTKIYETRVDMETKFMSLDEQMRVVMAQVEHRLKQSFNTKFEAETIKQSLNLICLASQLDHLNQSKVSLDSPIMKKITQETSQLTYHIDQFGYLMDENKHYILDDHSNLVKLNDAQLNHLKNQFN